MSNRDHTLVLNKNWTAITVTTSFGALISLFRGRARAMDPVTYELYDLEEWIDRSIKNSKDLGSEEVILTTSCPVEKPEIVILNEYGGIPFKQVNFTRRNLYKRDGYMCQYCSEAFTPKDLTIDHVVPRSRGGANSWTNCVASCEACNARKANRTPQECNMRLLKKPIMPRWTPIAGMLPAARPVSWDKFLKI